MGSKTHTVRLHLRPSIGAEAWKKFHAIMTPIWFLLIIPTVLFWNESVLWVGLISCYANAVGHFAAYQASRAELQTDSSTDK